MRRALGLTAAAGLARPDLLGRVARAADEPVAPGGLIVRSMRPLDLETPVTAFDRFLTPNNLFFVRSHLGEPSVEPETWKLEVGGLVDRPLTFSLDELRQMEQVRLPAVLQCSGNGRSNFSPTVPGVAWDRGGVGNAEWGGVRLVDLLKRAGMKAGAAHVHTLGTDVPPHVKTPKYLRSIPLDRANDPAVLVALTMNGEPLPILHGGPMRLVVPGWTGNHWMKWLRWITVAKDEAPGTYQQSGYKMPKVPAPPGAELKPSDLVSLTWMNVKSLIASPAEGSSLRRGRHEVKGVAWTGEGHVTKVEVQVGANGPWKPATLLEEPKPYTWRQWRFAWDADKAGQVVLGARATDSQGKTQPEQVDWNRSGYLWNGIDRVVIEVI